MVWGLDGNVDRQEQGRGKTHFGQRKEKLCLEKFRSPGWERWVEWGT
jgi:hypothetical protein